MRIELGRASIIGSRTEQQDRILCLMKKGQILVAVCDGMGGLADGALASETAVQCLHRLFTQKQDSVSFRDFYLQALEVMDEQIYALRKGGPHDQPVGTTIVSAGIARGYLNWLSVGDSRMYIMREQELIQITRDQNHFLQLEEARVYGAITEEQYQEESLMGETLISFLGMGGITVMDLNVQPLRLQPKDIIFLMSDGLYRSVSEQEMQQLAACGFSAQKLAEQLISLSERNSAGVQDNTSVIVLIVREEEQTRDSFGKEGEQTL